MDRGTRDNAGLAPSLCEAGPPHFLETYDGSRHANS